jgi:hypothetical protein
LPHSLRLNLNTGRRTSYVPLCSPRAQEDDKSVANLTLYVKILGPVVSVRS